MKSQNTLQSILYVIIVQMSRNTFVIQHNSLKFLDGEGGKGNLRDPLINFPSDALKQQTKTTKTIYLWTTSSQLLHSAQNIVVFLVLTSHNTP